MKFVSVELLYQVKGKKSIEMLGSKRAKWLVLTPASG